MSRSANTPAARAKGLELDQIEQTSWMLFLKYLDDLEHELAMEAELVGKAYEGLFGTEVEMTESENPAFERVSEIIAEFAGIDRTRITIDSADIASCERIESDEFHEDGPEGVLEPTTDPPHSVK